MSNSERKANLPAIVKTCEPDFNQLAKMHNVPSFTFARESAFALQALSANDFLARTALGNPDSLKSAIINVAAVGLSLSPVHKLAYLVPRDSKVCLDISYQGLKELAIGRGAVAAVSTVLVHESDEFEYHGPFNEPSHKCDIFADAEKRGPVIGGFCIADLPTGKAMVEFMALHKILEIRDRTDSWKAHIRKGSNTPWKSDPEEMYRKTLIRRAFKSWPRSAANEVLDRAVDVMDEAIGVDLNGPAPQLNAAEQKRKSDGLDTIRQFLAALDREEAAFVGHMCRQTNRTIKELEDLTLIEINQAVSFLESLVDGQKKRFEKLEAAKGKTRENAS